MIRATKEKTIRQLEKASGLSFVRVPAGRYRVGEAKKASKFAYPVSRKWRGKSPICIMRQTEVKVPSFYISTDVVRVSHWERLLQSKFGKKLEGAVPKAAIDWHGYNFVKDVTSSGLKYKQFAKDQEEEDPALTLPYEMSLRLAKVLGGSLPEWVQWEVATRGAEAYLYPWGNEFDTDQIKRSAYARQDSLFAYSGQLYRVDSFERYGEALSPFGLRGVARWGMEWNRTPRPLKTLSLDGTSGATIESHLLRSICDLGFNEVVIKGADFASMELAGSNHRAFSGPTLAMMLPAQDGNKVAGFRLVYLAEHGADLPPRLAKNFKKLAHLQKRYLELAVFPAHTDIPVETIERYWAHTARFSKSRSRLSIRVMCSLDLLEFTPVSKKNRRLAKKLDSYQGRRFWHGKPPYDTVRLPEKMIGYLDGLPIDKPALHRHLLDAHRPASGLLADLSRQDPYMWDHLLQHLLKAKRTSELLETVTDLRYLAARSFLYDVEASKKDLVFAQKFTTKDQGLQNLPDLLRDVLPLMKRCDSFNDMLVTLYNRLYGQGLLRPEFMPLVKRLATNLKPPYLVAQHARPWPNPSRLPNPEPQPEPQPQSQPIEMPGTSFGVLGAGVCAMSADGEVILSALRDEHFKLWDQQSGQIRLESQRDQIPEAQPFGRLRASIRDCALSADGRVIVSVESDDTLNVWDPQSAHLRLTLTQQPGPIWHNTRLPGLTGCAISADGRLIVSTHNDKLNLWALEPLVEQASLPVPEAEQACLPVPEVEQASRPVPAAPHSYKKRLTLIPEQGLRFLPLKVMGCAVSGNGELVVGIYQNSADLHVWDAQSGQLRFTLPAQGAYVTDCALTHDAKLIVSTYSGQFRGLVKVWDGKTGQERLTLEAHEGAVTGCAITRDGRLIITVSIDHTIKVWDSHRAAPLTTLVVDGPLYDCAVSADGERIVAIGERGIYFLRLVR
ncbi:MAG: SUMF1/EgtB/PvdO family nonheme iron enzyme [Ardenticatenaceae bacterium]